MARTRAGSILARLAGLMALALALALACSPKVVAGDASAGVDGVDAGVVDSLGDLDGGGGEGIADAVGDGDADAVTEDAVEVEEIADAITDATSEVAEVDADAAALPLDCTAGAMPAQADGLVLTDVGPLVPNKVVTGCGKGKPQPVAQPTECGCDCPPPYSCYCNGECAWLRTPDLNTPNEDGKAVWTGKWVVTMTNFYLGQNYKGEKMYKVVVERWNPESSAGFLLSVPPKPAIIPGTLRLFNVGGKVLATTETGFPPNIGLGLDPQRPAYWYDPETDKYESIEMPMCGELVATATHLACCDGGFGGDKGAVHLYDVAAKSWSKVKAPEALLPPGESICWEQYEKFVADEGNLYFINPVWSGSSAIWPDGSISKDGGHILRYDVAAQAWKDLGAVPHKFLGGSLQVVRFQEHLMFVQGGALDIAMFNIASGQTKIIKPVIPFYTRGVPLVVSCGIVFPNGHYFIAGEWSTATAYNFRPGFLNLNFEMSLLPTWGYPDDGRGLGTHVRTDEDILLLGGYSDYEHKDGYRYPLSQVCKGAKP